MAQQSFSTKAGTPINAPIALAAGDGFARSVIIGNTTSQWCEVAGVAQPIPPNSPAAVYPLQSGTTNAIVTWLTPSGYTPNPLDATQVATFTFTSDVLPPSPPQAGFANPVPQQLLQTAAGATSFTTTVGGVGSASFTVPSGTQSVMVVWQTLTATATQPSAVGVFDSSGKKLTWGNISMPTPSILADTNMIVPVSNLVTPTIYVEVSSPATVQHRVWVLAYQTPAAVAAAIAGSDIMVPVFTEAGVSLGVFFPTVPSVQVNNAAIIPDTALSTVASFGPGAGTTTTIFNLFDTVGHRYIYEWTMDCAAVAAAAAGSAMFMSIKGHTSGAASNILCCSALNSLLARDLLKNVLDVQFWLNPATDPKYDITLTNNSAVGGSGTCRLINGPTTP